VTVMGLGLMGMSAFCDKPHTDDERFKLLDHALQLLCILLLAVACLPQSIKALVTLRKGTSENWRGVSVFSRELREQPKARGQSP
jgi:hypothetical protein